MEFWLILIFIQTVCSTNYLTRNSFLQMQADIYTDTQEETYNDEIVRGKPGTLGQFSYQVFLEVNTTKGILICSGTLVNVQWILTAAHCTKPTKSDTVLEGVHKVYLGIIKRMLTQNKKMHFAHRPIVHPNWDESTHLNDIALLQLKTPVIDWTNVAIVELASHPFYNHQGIVSGWGSIDPAGKLFPNRIRFARMKILDQIKCPIIFPGAIINDAVLCAASEIPHETTCKGDSGGPLVVSSGGELYQVGILSYGTPICDATVPDIFTSVSFHREWIKNNIGE